jgi:DNA-binding winged helix-turn-helix (wHTH) protein
MPYCVTVHRSFDERASKTPPPLPGEDIRTKHWEDARHWMSIYADLLDFKKGILDRVEHDVTMLPPVAREAAEADVRIIETQMRGYEMRYAIWYRRIMDLHGLMLDPKGRLVRHKGKQAALTVREFQLCQLLLDHPHRFFTPEQILDRAWGEPNHFPEQVRNYVRRLRMVLAALDIPCDLVNRVGRGYSLQFRTGEPTLPNGLQATRRKKRTSDSPARDIAASK